jgi:hypothetical protein
MAKGGQSRPRMRHKIVVRKLRESGSKAGEVDVDIRYCYETVSKSGKYQIMSLRNYTYQVSNR